MKKLEQYIRNHKNLFEEEPASGHFERLQQKIQAKQHPVSLSRLIVGIAASVTLVLSAGLLWWYTHQPSNTLAICDNADDMKLCYLDKMNDVAEKIFELSKDQWDQELVMEDVKGIIEANQNFEKEIPEDLPDEAVKSILSDYYQHNLESLYTIANVLKEKEAIIPSK
ncbi:MAG: hypothetical protein LBQ60_18625 [Bacteroidales bacterium]|jgi:hypothetical protein|nr:hypothetical protein [Bacteroidales bacterium]